MKKGFYKGGWVHNPSETEVPIFDTVDCAKRSTVGGLTLAEYPVKNGFLQ